MSTKKIIFLATLCTIFSTSLFSQVDGTLDSTFNGIGKVTADFGYTDLFNDVKVQPDQKIVASGLSYDASWGADLKVFRFLPNGSYDTGFGTGGIFTLSLNYEAYAYESHINNDGTILVSGITNGASGAYAMLLVKLKGDGAIDSVFGTNGITVADFTSYDDIAQSMTVQSDGKILLAGMITDSLMRNIPTVARFTSNGIIDSTFGINGIAQISIVEADNEFTSVIQQPDGKIIASGHYAPSLFSHSVLLVRFNANGTLDSSFGVGGVVTNSLYGYEDESFGMQLKADGHILVAGFTTKPGYDLDGLLIQYDSTGTPDVSFGTSGFVKINKAPFDVFSDMKIQSDDKILCAGTSGPGGSGDDDFFLCRFKSNGSIDSSFGISGYIKTQFFGSRDAANAMDIQADGKIILAGKADNPTSVLDYAICRYTNTIIDGTASISEISESSSFAVWPNPVSVNQSLTLNYDLKNNGNVEIEFYNVLGSKINSIDLGQQTKGNHKTEIQLPLNISNGLYFLKINNKEFFNSTFKLIIN